MSTRRADAPPAPSPDSPTDDSFSPRGTLLFVLLMLVGYALYWAYLWVIVVLERAAGAA